MRLFRLGGTFFLIGIGAAPVAAADPPKALGATLNAEAVLRLLGGRYDAEEGAARLRIPMDGGEEAECRAYLLDVAAWSAEGKERALFLTKTLCAGHDAHVDGALLGGGVLEKREGRWAPVNVSPTIAEFGAFGDFRGEVSTVPLGERRIGFLLRMEGMHQGVAAGVLSLWGTRDDRLAEILPPVVVSEDGCAGQECVDTVKEQDRFEKQVGYRPPLRWAFGSELRWSAAAGAGWNELVVITTGTESDWTEDRQTVRPVRRTRRFAFSEADGVYVEHP